MAENKIEIRLTAKDDASRVFKNFADSVERVFKDIQQSSNRAVADIQNTWSNITLDSAFDVDISNQVDNISRDFDRLEQASTESFDEIRTDMQRTFENMGDEMEDFVTETRRDFDRLEQTSDESAGNIKQDWQDVGRKSKESFAGFSGDTKRELDKIETASADTANDFYRNMERSTEKAEDSFDELRKEATKDLNQLSDEAEESVQGIGGLFSKLGGLSTSLAAGGGGLAGGAAGGGILGSVLFGAAGAGGAAAGASEVLSKLEKFKREAPAAFAAVLPSAGTLEAKLRAVQDAGGGVNGMLGRLMTTVGRFKTVLIGAGVTIAAVLITKFAGAMIEVGSTWDKTLFEMRYTFGEMASEVRVEAKELAERVSYYFSSREIIYAFNKTAGLMERYGLTFKQQSKLVEASADIAAAKGLELREAIDRVESAIRGEAEASEYLQLTLNDTFMKTIAFEGALEGVWEQLDETTKAQFRLQELLKQSAKYTGAAAEGSETLTGAWNELKNALGENVGPALASVTRLLADIINVGGEAVKWINKVIDTADDLPTAEGGGFDEVPEGRQFVRSPIPKADDAMQVTEDAMENIRNVVKKVSADMFKDMDAAFTKIEQRAKEFSQKQQELAKEAYEKFGVGAEIVAQQEVQQLKDRLAKFAQFGVDQRTLQDEAYKGMTEIINRFSEQGEVGVINMLSSIRNESYKWFDDMQEGTEQSGSQLETMQSQLYKIWETISEPIQIDASSATAQLESLKDDIEKLRAKLEEVAKIDADPTQALKTFNEIKAQWKALKAEIEANPIIQKVETVGTGSPTMPFSKYMDYMQDRINALDSIMGMTADFSGMSAYIEALRGVRDDIQYFQNQAQLIATSPGATLALAGYHQQVAEMGVELERVVQLASQAGIEGVDSAVSSMRMLFTNMRSALELYGLGNQNALLDFQRLQDSFNDNLLEMLQVIDTATSGDLANTVNGNGTTTTGNAMQVDIHFGGITINAEVQGRNVEYDSEELAAMVDQKIGEEILYDRSRIRDAMEDVFFT